jgi:sec-independent protein translocase protein TatA
VNFFRLPQALQSAGEYKLHNAVVNVEKLRRREKPPDTPEKSGYYPGRPAGVSDDDPSIGGPMFEGLFQPMHLLVVLGIALLLFGPKKLPELGKGLGEGIRKFKSSLREDGQESPLASEVHPDEGNPGNI